MSKDEQLKKMRLKILGDVTQTNKDTEFKDKLDDAEVVALNALFPSDLTIETLPDNKRIKNWQVRCAIELYKAEQRIGYQSYSENGLSVSFLTSLVSPDLMNELFPRVGVPK